MGERGKDINFFLKRCFVLLEIFAKIVYYFFN